MAWIERAINLIDINELTKIEIDRGLTPNVARDLAEKAIRRGKKLSERSNKLLDDQLGKEKTEFIDYLFGSGILKFGGEWKLKSGRRSPCFLNFGDANNGEAITELGHFFADEASGIFDLIDRHAVDKPATEIKTLVGPTYKGISIALITSAALFTEHKRTVGYTYDRKEEKPYGEGTDTSREAAGKRIFVGYIPKDGDNVLLLDDVITTGKTKEDEIAKLRSVANVTPFGLLIGGNRQELDEDGNDPIVELGNKYHMPIHSIVNVITETVPYLLRHKKIDEQTRRRMVAYTRTYGIESSKQWSRELTFIKRPRGIIPACDVPLAKFEEVVKETRDIEGIVGYKIPATSGRVGWETWVKRARRYTRKPLIYDQQKAGTDIPDIAKDFMKEVKAAGFDAVILFPESGPTTQWECIHSAFEQDLDIIAGGEMTHPRFKASEGGYINDEALSRMYLIAAKAGVNNFVMPGNKPERMRMYKSEIESAIRGIKMSIFSPGLVAQGGKISEAAKVAGDSWYGIVGRGIYEAPDIKAAALEYASQL